MEGKDHSNYKKEKPTFASFLLLSYFLHPVPMTRLSTGVIVSTDDSAVQKFLRLFSQKPKPEPVFRQLVDPILVNHPIPLFCLLFLLSIDP